jgi:hypothetical protein
LASIVEGRDQRLSRPGWGHDEIAEMPFVDPLRLKLIEGSLLVRVRPKIKEHWWSGVAASRPAFRILQRQLHPSAKFFIIWPELFKFLITP